MKNFLLRNWWERPASDRRRKETRTIFILRNFKLIDGDKKVLMIQKILGLIIDTNANVMA